MKPFTFLYRWWYLRHNNEAFNPSNISIYFTRMYLTELECANSCDEEFSNLGKLSPEVSAIYLAMQHSKLECVDEPTQESMSTDMCVEYEDDDFDDFDPYFFIKNLPDLSAVVPTFRPMLLPRQTRSCPSTTLVLDLDGMLVKILLLSHLHVNNFYCLFHMLKIWRETILVHCLDFHAVSMPVMISC